MRYQKPKRGRAAQKEHNVSGTESISAPVVRYEPQKVVISNDEARVLGFIRKDVIWSASILVLIVVGFVVVSMTAARDSHWAPLAEKIARSAGLIR